MTQEASKSSQVLIVEDDKRLRLLLAKYLRTHGFDVHQETHGDGVVERVRRCRPDIIVLDVLLPGADGFEVCRRTRQVYDGGILILTACKTDAEQMTGLEVGADDYVVKPIDPRILVARLRAILRRLQPPTEAMTPILKLGGVSANARHREAQVNGRCLGLTGAEFDVLWTLLRCAGEVVMRDELHRTVRGVEYNGLDRSIDIHVSRLRRKLRSLGADERIKAVRGAGYILAGP